MKLSEIIEQCRGLEVFEQRYNSEDYKELVFFNADLSRWQQILETALGPAVKPSGVEPTKEHIQSTANYGGIYRHQTLFKKQNEKGTIIVMFWPWEDSEHVTLKMALTK